MADMDYEGVLRKTTEANRKYIEEKKKRDGILPESEKYAPVMAAPMQDVEANAERFIMTECLPACRELWKKNVYTFMVSDAQNDEAWIEVFADGLSEENKSYMLELDNKGVHVFCYHDGTISFGAGCFGKKAQDILLEISKGFQMQDVAEDFGYVDAKTALFLCGCTKKEKNPDYVMLKLPTNGDIEMTMEYYDWLAKGGEEQEYRDVFDPSKVKSPIEENFKGTPYVYVPEEDRVYLSEYHYKKHLNYLKYLESLEHSQGVNL